MLTIMHAVHKSRAKVASAGRLGSEGRTRARKAEWALLRKKMQMKNKIKNMKEELRETTAGEALVSQAWRPESSVQNGHKELDMAMSADSLSTEEMRRGVCVCVLRHHS